MGGCRAFFLGTKHRWAASVCQSLFVSCNFLYLIYFKYYVFYIRMSNSQRLPHVLPQQCKVKEKRHLTKKDMFWFSFLRIPNHVSNCMAFVFTFSYLFDNKGFACSYYDSFLYRMYSFLYRGSMFWAASIGKIARSHTHSVSSRLKVWGSTQFACITPFSASVYSPVKTRLWISHLQS